MTAIVCAVRGGPGSHFARREALRRAAEGGRALYFLSVVDPADYKPLHEGEQRAIRAEMAWRELALARANAAQLGHPEIQFNIQIRIGHLGDTIADFVTEVDAGVLILGEPRAAIDAALSPDGIDSMAADLRNRFGLDVEVVRPSLP